MRILGLAALVLLLLIGGCMAGYKLAYPTYIYRYRMTVEVMVGSTVHSGSSVIEIKINKQPQFGDVGPYISHVRGEAVYVDLGRGRNVIALLASGPDAQDDDYPKYIVPNLFGLAFNDQDLAELSTLSGSKVLPSGQLPTFVTITDLDDPKTVRVVPLGAFPQIFGSDVHLKNVRIEMTGDPVTKRIEQKLPWLPHPRYLSGQFACNPVKELCLHGGDFTRD